LFLNDVIQNMNTEKKIAFIDVSSFEKLLDNLSQEREVFVPQAVENSVHGIFYSYEKRTPEKEFCYAGFRPSQSLKTFMFDGRMKVAEYPSEEDTMPVSQPRAIVGAAACDIVSLKSLDAVFLQEEFTDIFYQQRRNDTLLISEDCTEPRETCFCTLAGDCPYSKEGFDLNLSKVEGGYLIEAGSEKGVEVMKQNASLFSPSSIGLLDERDKSRSRVTGKVEDINKEYVVSKNRRELLEIQRESEDWHEHVQNCIECGACLFSCPTCHCFILYDQAGDTSEFQRVKNWDVCVYAGFSKMAGGGTPRFGIMERFRHRYLHKFEYFPQNYDFEACTGCGRCIEGCMGKIDIRKVFKALDTATAGVR